MNMLDLVYRYDQWGMRQNHAGSRNNNRFDDPNLLLISVVAEPPNIMPHRSACLPSDTKHSRENTRLLGSVEHTPGENPKIHIFAIRITNERLKLTSFLTSSSSLYMYVRV